jgi:hypothetical protein
MNGERYGVTGMEPFYFYITSYGRYQQNMDRNTSNPTSGSLQFHNTIFFINISHLDTNLKLLEWLLSLDELGLFPADACRGWVEGWYTPENVYSQNQSTFTDPDSGSVFRQMSSFVNPDPDQTQVFFITKVWETFNCRKFLHQKTSKMTSKLKEASKTLQSALQNMKFLLLLLFRVPYWPAEIQMADSLTN